jgi:hypothetical protein
VLGAYGAHGARAARVWARLERFLAEHAPAARDALLPGWRAPPPREEAGTVRVHPSVAAYLALHAGQVTLTHVRLPNVVALFAPPFRAGHPTHGDTVLAAASGLGMISTYGAMRTGALHPPLLHYRVIHHHPDPANTVPMVGAPLPQRFRALEWRGEGALDVRTVRSGTLFPLLVTSPDWRTHRNDGPEMLGHTRFLDLESGGVYAFAAGRAAAAVDRRTGRRGSPYQLLVRADGGLGAGGGGGGLLAWLERLVDLYECGVLLPCRLALEVDPGLWQHVRGRDPGEWAALVGHMVGPPDPVGLSGFPGLPLDAGLAPADLAALAAAWGPDVGVSVALTGGQLQMVAGVVYATTGDEGGGFVHVWSYRLTLRLLDPAGGAGSADAADAAGTWPPLTPRPGDGDALPPQQAVPALRAARLVERLWVLRDGRGRFKDRYGGPGVVGETPRLVAGEAGPHFSYASRTTEAAAGSERAVDASIMPGSVLGEMDGAFLFEGEAVDGRAVRFWARTPRMVLRVLATRF